ncbi:hypothetical protein [Paraflavitalea pollutisoli]|uniref:hypothetical protein n=1 Tax=Paraflavitalea pollutisoli TaxID=3034143 RepID=UPI0023EC19EB|nr:hypothetical protein [Paraflavitalea sp. H1-2-19X]
MKRSWTKYIIGCFLIVAFLFNGIVPDVMILSGHVNQQLVEETMTGQDKTKSERNTEEKQADPRAENLPDAPSTFYIDPVMAFFSADHIIPRNISFTDAVCIPVPTPPPDITIL